MDLDPPAHLTPTAYCLFSLGQLNPTCWVGLVALYLLYNQLTTITPPTTSPTNNNWCLLPYSLAC
uniref:Uncharacterized protein n=1 Tax=Picea glauca TaxID=3330 RepID=A0A124GMP5_PICGL|nr:hypothetical protein ABT39_MTgene1818 [Picea glauca]QHR91827.1 hypothetical protein Q903MT_gene5863 [Picea sitchensis]